MKNLKNNSNLPNSGIDDNAAEALILGGGGDCAEARLIREIEDEKAALLSQSVAETNVITDFSAVPPNKVFDRKTFFRVFNRVTKREFIINGAQLEAKIGIDEALFQRVKTRKVRAFALAHFIVRFEKRVG